MAWRHREWERMGGVNGIFPRRNNLATCEWKKRKQKTINHQMSCHCVDMIGFDVFCHSPSGWLVALATRNRRMLLLVTVLASIDSFMLHLVCLLKEIIRGKWWFRRVCNTLMGSNERQKEVLYITLCNTSCLGKVFVNGVGSVTLLLAHRFRQEWEGDTLRLLKFKGGHMMRVV